MQDDLPQRNLPRTNNHELFRVLGCNIRGLKYRRRGLIRWADSLQDRRRLMKASLSLIFFFLLAIAGVAQVRGPGADYAITKITKNLISAPQFTYSGAEQFQANQRELWLEVEVEFSAAPQWTDELTFRYFILFNGKLLSGEVTHTNIPAGRDNRSVMYVAPRTLLRFGGGRTVTANMIQNVTVQLLQQGAVKGELSLQRAPPQWFNALPQVAGFVLNKNETPFAPLYWDRYEQIKTPTR